MFVTVEESEIENVKLEFNTRFHVKSANNTLGIVRWINDMNGQGWTSL